MKSKGKKQLRRRWREIKEVEVEIDESKGIGR
jgi:hypothetical protein